MFGAPLALNRVARFVSLGLLVCISPTAQGVSSCEKPPKYISGAGIRLRSTPLESAQIVAQLRFNTPICETTVQSAWSRVRSLDKNQYQGWLLSQYVSSSPTPYDVLIGSAQQLKDQREFVKAIKMAERAAEAAQPESESERTALALTATLRKLVEQPEASLPASANEDFDSWFFEKFGDSSQYHSGLSASDFSSGDLERFLSELEARISRAKVAHEHSPSLELMLDLLSERIMPLAFQSEPNEWPKKIKDRLVDKKLLLSVLPMKFSVVQSLPETSFRDSQLTDLVLKHCSSNFDGFSFWRNIPGTLKAERLESIFSCVPVHEVLEFVLQNPEIKTPDFLSKYLLRISSGSAETKYVELQRVSLAFQAMDLKFRNDPKVLEILMKYRVSIHLGLPPVAQRDLKYVSYSMKIGDCISVVKSNPKDFDFILQASRIDRFSPPCVELIDREILKDKQKFLALLPVIFYPFLKIPESLQKDPEVLSAFTGLIKTLGRRMIDTCPTSHFGSLSKPLKLLLADTFANCLAEYTPTELLDPKVRDIVLGRPIIAPLLKKLPEEYKNDPRVPPLLPTEYWLIDKTLYLSFLKPQVLLKVVRSSGLRDLERFVWRDDYIEESFALCDPQFDFSFWRSAAIIEKERKTPCEGWFELFTLIASCKNGDQTKSEIQKVTGCGTP